MPPEWTPQERGSIEGEQAVPVRAGGFMPPERTPQERGSIEGEQAVPLNF